MYKSTMILMSAICLIAGIFITACNAPVQEVQASEPDLTDQQFIERGKYLATVGGCHDCHSPKVFTEKGMELDATRLLSGHPANSPLPPVDVKALEPGNWMLFAGDLTAGVGPWGMSFARNLTPHETGIKGWSLEVFTQAMRTGKHMGVEQGRPIMPPMPWMNLAQATDEDLKSIYLFLMSLPPIDNKAPDPMGPDEVRAMAEEANI